MYTKTNIPRLIIGDDHIGIEAGERTMYYASVESEQKAE